MPPKDVADKAKIYPFAVQYHTISFVLFPLYSAAVTSVLYPSV